MEEIHQSVLLKEILEIFDPQSGQIYIDGTVNGGGHARAIAERVGQKGSVIGVDWDCDLIERLQKEHIKNVEPVCGSYGGIGKIAEDCGVAGKVNGILFDFGFSSYHIAQSGRGFSFQKEEPLDMRYNIHENKTTAADIVNTWQEQAIADILRNFGEERYAARIAQRIVDARRIKKITTTNQLADIVRGAVSRRGGIDPATRTFQALRIAVNHELENIGKGLEAACAVLAPEGIVIAIAFHSLEDRIIKNFFKAKEKSGELKILTKKPLIASSEEIRTNPRARSAKLRAAQRT